MGVLERSVADEKNFSSQRTTNASQTNLFDQLHSYIEDAVLKL